MRALSLLLVSAAACAAAEWTYVASPNFELYTTAGAKEARKTIEYFEQVRDFFMRGMSSEFTTRLPVTIIAFRNPSEYKPYSARPSASAFYVGDRDRDFIVMSGTGAEHFPMAVHEYVHLLTRHIGLNPPLWLNEGLAEVFSTLKPSAGRLQVGAIPPGRAATLAREKWIPLQSLLAIHHGSSEYTEGNRIGIFYAQSWLLTHMLLLEEDFRPGFGRFLQAVADGSSAEDAFEKVWSLSVPQMQKQLTAYMHQPLNAALFNTTLDKFAGLEPRPADSVNVEITLSNLLLFLDRKDEVQSRLEALALRHADSWRVQEALALLAWRRSDIGAAREHFAKAAELNSPSWKTWWDYARLMQGIDQDDAVIRALRRVLELNPSYTEARILLADEFNYVHRYKDALATLSNVGRVPPDLAAPMFLAAAQAYAELGAEDEARKAATHAKETARDPSHLRRAAEILRYLDLKSRPAPPSAPQAQTLRASGTFQSLECTGREARMHIATANGALTLAIPDPSMITIRGKSPSMTLNCGKQPPGASVTVEYIPPDTLCTLEFK